MILKKSLYAIYSAMASEVERKKCKELCRGVEARSSGHWGAYSARTLPAEISLCVADAFSSIRAKNYLCGEGDEN